MPRRPARAGHGLLDARFHAGPAVNRTLLVFLLALAAPVFAADLEIYSAGTTGTITVAPDGTVADVRLEGRNLLGTSEIDGYERHIRTWRFEPVLEDGVPVRALAHLSLSLVAAREAGSGQASFGIRNVWFLDPPKPGSAGRPVGASADFKPPVYPAKALRTGVGGEVMLLAEVGPDGLPTRVAAEHVYLLGTPVQGKRATSIAESLASVAERAAATWRYRGYPAGMLVRTPVRFTPQGAGWMRLSPHERPTDPWVAIALAKDGDLTDLAAAGAAPSRLTLLSKLPSVPGMEDGG